MIGEPLCILYIIIYNPTRMKSPAVHMRNIIILLTRVGILYYLYSGPLQYDLYKTHKEHTHPQVTFVHIIICYYYIKII